MDDKFVNNCCDCENDDDVDDVDDYDDYYCLFNAIRDIGQM